MNNGVNGDQRSTEKYQSKPLYSSLFRRGLRYEKIYQSGVKGVWHNSHRDHRGHRMMGETAGNESRRVGDQRLGMVNYSFQFL